MATPSKVIAALVPKASIYPPLTAYHMVLLESLDCSLAKLSEPSGRYSWFDLALAHVAFSNEGRALKATIDRDGRDWLNKQAMEWSTTITPKKLRDLLADLAEHIEEGMGTAVAFEGEQKKTNAVGHSPLPSASPLNTESPSPTP